MYHVKRTQVCCLPLQTFYTWGNAWSLIYACTQSWDTGLQSETIETNENVEQAHWWSVIHMGTIRTHTHTPGSMLNFSISRNTCLLSILGWIWSVWCLERDKRGNCLQWSTRKHKPPTNATHAQKELRTHTHTQNTCVVVLCWSQDGTRSPAVWPYVPPV